MKRLPSLKKVTINSELEKNGVASNITTITPASFSASLPSSTELSEQIQRSNQVKIRGRF